MLFLVWYDEDSRRSVVEKIQNALAAYSKRFSVAGDLVLINVADSAELKGVEVEVRSERTVQPHHFWVGRSDDHDAAGVAEEREAPRG
ncbi:MAG: hypothetical protein WCI67_02935 [Chloroflexales bacterium]